MQATYRVLQVVSTMNCGGIETFIMNHYRAIDRSIIQFDFLLHTMDKCDYDDEIEQLGGKIYRTLPIRPWRYRSYFNFLDNFFKEHKDYVAVHSHIQDNSGIVLKYASINGIKNLISHSHTAGVEYGIKYPFQLYANKLLQKYTNVRLACGDEAGKRLFKNRPFEVFRNAIISERFIFNESIRNSLRKKLNLDGYLVVGNVARFSPSKNHTFCIDVFNALHQINAKSKMIFIGEGSEMDRIKAKCARLGIIDDVIFMGLRRDVNELLQTMDVFLFPSIYEGLPVALIEAQASGIPCILSDTIDKTTQITENVEFMSLSSPETEWTNRLIQLGKLKHIDATKALIENGYDIKANIDRLMGIYLNKI